MLAIIWKNLNFYVCTLIIYLHSLVRLSIIIFIIIIVKWLYNYIIVLYKITCINVITMIKNDKINDKKIKKFCLILHIKNCVTLKITIWN